MGYVEGFFGGVVQFYYCLDVEKVGIVFEGVEVVEYGVELICILG